MSKTTRRKFLKSSLYGAAGASTFCSLPASAAPRGANEDLRIAVIGCGGRGSGHVGGLLGQKGVRVAGICDADYKHSEKNVKRVKDKQGSAPRSYEDYRKLCADPDIDGVMIATPNHLHAIVSIEAARNGKHVYVEKPISHNIWEGRKQVEAAEKYGKEKGVVFQHGMQRRSDVGWREIMEWIKDEPLGKMTVSRGFCYKPRKSIGKVDGPQKPPAEVDYNLWSGPREILPIMRGRFHYDWHWQWPYGNGDIGNQGPHQMDVARWALGEEALSPTVLSFGGRFGYDDDGTTANTQVAYFDYEVPLIFEVRGLPNSKMDWGKGMPHYKGARVGNVIEFEGGYISESKAYDKDGKSVKKFGVTNGRGHLENWIAAIREGVGEKIENELSGHTGHISGALAHMANISYQIGAEAKPEEIKEKVAGDKLKLDAYERFAEHLDANGVDISKDMPVLGAALTMDPETELFTGDHAEEANKLGRGTYRKEFSIPDPV